MEKYPFSGNGGVVIIDIGGQKTIVDTGSPSSASKTGIINLPGKKIEVPQSFCGVSVDELEGHLGEKFDALLGCDLLKDLWVDIDWSDFVLTIDKQPPQRETENIFVGDAMGVPIAELSLKGSLYNSPLPDEEPLKNMIRGIVDTGSRLSYMTAGLLAALSPGQEEEDFYPGIGKFKTPTWRVVFEVAGKKRGVTVGRLPAALEMLLSATGTQAVFGNNLLQQSQICLGLGANKVLVNRFADEVAFEQEMLDSIEGIEE